MHAPPGAAIHRPRCGRARPGRTLRAGLLLAALLALAACRPLAVAIDYQPGIDFQALRHYYWLPPAIQPDPATVYNSELMTARVEQLAEQALAQQGLQRTRDRRGADLLVQLHLAVQQRLSIDPLRAAEGSYSRHPAAYDFVPPYQASAAYHQVTLVIDLRAAADQRLLWRGTALRRLPSLEGPAQYRDFIAESLAAILRAYPP